jgi:hypothetical protein
MATQPRDSSEGTSSIGTVPYSTTVARPTERFDLQHHSSFTISIRAKLRKRRIVFPSSALERAKIKKFGLDLINRLARRSRNDQVNGPRRYDEIFGEHIENEGEAQRQAKLDTPEPATLSPVPDVKKHENQAGWEKRFVAMKNKHTTALRGKRSSLKTWLTQFDKSGLEIRDGKVVSSDTAAKPLRRKKSLKLRIQKWSARSTTDIQISKEPEASLSSPSLTSDTTSNNIPEPTSPTPPQTWPKRASSTGSLRTKISFDKDLAVPNRNPKPTQPLAVPIQTPLSQRERTARAPQSHGWRVRGSRRYHPLPRVAGVVMPVRAPCLKFAFSWPNS